jgi:hypothetical protein
VTPVGIIRRSKTVRIGYVIFVLLAIAAVWPHPTAAALSVKKTVEKIIPVTVQVKANLTVTLPPVINTTPARQVINNLTVPLQSPASPVVETATQTIPVAASPAVTLSTSSAPANTPPPSATKSAKAASDKKQTSTLKSNTEESTSSSVVLIPFGGADFLSVAFTSALQNSADQMTYRKADSLSVIASAGAFLLSLTIVMGVIYAMLRKNIIPIGNGVLSQLVTYYSTRTQVLVLIVVVLVAELIGIFLVLSLQAPAVLG